MDTDRLGGIDSFKPFLQSPSACQAAFVFICLYSFPCAFSPYAFFSRNFFPCVLFLYVFLLHTFISKRTTYFLPDILQQPIRVKDSPYLLRYCPEIFLCLPIPFQINVIPLQDFRFVGFIRLKVRFLFPSAKFPVYFVIQKRGRIQHLFQFLPGRPLIRYAKAGKRRNSLLILDKSRLVIDLHGSAKVF